MPAGRPATARRARASAQRFARSSGPGAALRRTSPEEALDLWQALFEGRWSIVEQVESDGKRVILARRNEPGVSDPRSLTPGERDVLAYAALGHSNKYVAFPSE